MTTTKTLTPLLDHYESIAYQRGASFEKPPSEAGFGGRAQAVARRLLIETHRREYDLLYSAVSAELRRRYQT